MTRVNQQLNESFARQRENTRETRVRQKGVVFLPNNTIQSITARVCVHAALEIRISLRPNANAIPTPVAARLIPHVRYVART